MALLTLLGVLEHGSVRLNSQILPGGQQAVDVTHLMSGLAWPLQFVQRMNSLSTANVLFPAQILHELFAVGREFLGCLFVRFFFIKGK